MSESSPRPFPVRRAILWVLGGGLLVWGATWVGPLAFYLSFQRPLLAESPESELRSVVWSQPERGESLEASTWDLLEEAGHVFRVPPGKIVETAPTGEGARARLEEGELLVQTFPPGFLVGLYAHELDLVSSLPDSLPPDAEVLERALFETPESYSLGLAERERGEYAARILLKMLLLEVRVATRERFARVGETAVHCSEFADGAGRVIVVDAKGVVVVNLPEGRPASWTESLGVWVR